MTEHFPKSTEQATLWCNVCFRPTVWKISGGLPEHCTEHGSDIGRFYCDVCKEGTPHLIDKNGKAHCLAHKPAETEEFRFDHTTDRHLAALDGMGNRGEKKGEKKK